jgi:hypothetical protein
MMNVETGMALTDVTSAGAFDYHGKARHEQGALKWSLQRTTG